MDEKLRNTKREATTGDVVTAARALRERVRAGQIPRWALYVGAALGDPSCLLVCSLPEDHHETLAELFDMLTTNTKPKTMLEWLTLALRCWSDHEWRSAGGVAGSPEVRDLLEAVEGVLDGGVIPPPRIAYVAERLGHQQPMRSVGLSMLELVNAWAFTPDRPFGGSNPAAVGAWLDRGGDLPTKPVGGLTLLIRHRLRANLLPRLLEEGR